MIRKILIAIITVIAFSTIGYSADPFSSTLKETDDNSGDNPPITTYIWQGSGELKIHTITFSGVNNPRGTITVNSIPEDAEIVCAFLGTSSWNMGLQPASAIFCGNDLGSMDPLAHDVSYYTLSFYHWDISPFLTGNGDYEFGLFGAEHCYLVYIVLIYELDILPEVRIVLNEGAEQLHSATTETLLPGFASGSGSVLVMTQCGSGTSIYGSECITLNGDTIAGPANLFWNRVDIYEINVANLQYLNTLRVTAENDLIGVQLACITGEIGSLPDVNVDLTLQNPPVQIPPGGGEFYYDVMIENTDSLLAGNNFWTMAIYPGDSTRGPLKFCPNLVIESGTIFDHNDIFQLVPGDAPSGIYYLVGNVGSYPDYIIDSDTLQIEKLSSDNNECNSHQIQLITNPNPFNQSVRLNYMLPAAADVRLSIYDITGREVASLVNGHSSLGQHSVVWNAEDLSSGVYFVRLSAVPPYGGQAFGQQSVKKVVLIK